MAALSSMMRMRRLARDVGLAMSGLCRAAGQFESECGAAARSAARHPQRAAELLSRECPAVQAETMPVHASGKTVSEQAGHIFRGNAHAVVDDGDVHTGRRLFDAQRDEFVRSARFIARVLGVAYEIHQYLQDLVLIDGDRR